MDPRDFYVELTYGTTILERDLTLSNVHLTHDAVLTAICHAVDPG